MPKCRGHQPKRVLPYTAKLFDVYLLTEVDLYTKICWRQGGSQIYPPSNFLKWREILDIIEKKYWTAEAKEIWNESHNES